MAKFILYLATKSRYHILWASAENNIEFIHQFEILKICMQITLEMEISGEIGSVFHLSNPGVEDAVPTKALAGAMELFKTLFIIDNF